MVYWGLTIDNYDVIGYPSHWTMLDLVGYSST